jgi:hypothetical protein
VEASHALEGVQLACLRVPLAESVVVKDIIPGGFCLEGIEDFASLDV